MIAPFGMGAQPGGWLICDGRAISRTTYIDLWNIIDDIWGPGNSSSTFNIPDLRGAYLRNIGTAILDANYVGPTAVGDYQSDQITLHEHTYWTFVFGTGGATSSTVGGATHPSVGAFPTTHGGQTGNTGDEVRVYNYGVQYCIKY
jgi:microcystin-dependent protein